MQIKVLAEWTKESFAKKCNETTAAWLQDASERKNNSTATKILPTV